MITECVDCLKRGYLHYHAGFNAITRRAADRFRRQDWPGMRRDTLARLDLYDQVVRRVSALLQERLGSKALERTLWIDLKERYDRFFARQRCDAELARTFFNSVRRRSVEAAGVDPAAEFIDMPDGVAECSHPAMLNVFSGAAIDPAMIQAILESYLLNPLRDVREDARRCAVRIRERLGSLRSARIEMLAAPFFRDMNAYFIGRIRTGGRSIPLVFALGSGARGIFVDALLLSSEELRVLFSFSRSYFHVRSPCSRVLVDFLKELMPHKRLAELYIGLGYHKHGKTELFRDLLRHREVCESDRFEAAAGQRGMVMIAFYMPRDDLIYKVIRDRFASPKHTTRFQVMQKYDYVFKHDRAGRLVDVQTFEHLQVDQCCFTDALIADLRREAARVIELRDGKLFLDHVYVERRVTPLDVYLQQAAPQLARAAVIDYGQAIKDLARVNVFPGDLLVKNFGVTRLGRVVFYDYDELCPLTECNFRDVPHAMREEDAMAAEPWYMVAPNDVFPEEFAPFLGLSAEMLAVFQERHADLFSPEFWRRTQAHIRSGHWTPIRPYTEAARLSPPEAPR